MGYNSGPGGSLDNTTAIGSGARVGSSNHIQLGNAAITALRCQVGLTVISDARFKYDVRPDVPGLAFITRLRPVTYRLDAARQDGFQRTGTLPAFIPDATAPLHTGFLAQEVEATARALGYAFDGVHAPATARDTYGLAYAQFVVPLVRAVQELNHQVADLKAQNTALKSQATAFAQRLRALEAAGTQATASH